MLRLWLLIAALLLQAAGQSARADWMFRRSDYSHSPQWGIETGPNRFARGPYYTQPQGAVVRFGYRNLNSNQSFKGGTWDHLHYVESWIQYAEQW
jgi:hypothetical protein